MASLRMHVDELIDAVRLERVLCFERQTGVVHCSPAGSFEVLHGGEATRLVSRRLRAVVPVAKSRRPGTDYVPKGLA